jgi:hypothetical protein
MENEEEYDKSKISFSTSQNLPADKMNGFLEEDQVSLTERYF